MAVRLIEIKAGILADNRKLAADIRSSLAGSGHVPGQHHVFPGKRKDESHPPHHRGAEGLRPDGCH